MSRMEVLLLFATLGDTAGVASICRQVAPLPINGTWRREAAQTRAVVLIHGFQFHLRDASVAKAEFRPWQSPDSALVKELSKCADVYVFAYGQNVALDEVVKDCALGMNIAELRKLGYREIVLMGHSAGGLLARHFVEDNPEAGISKVIQVCTPNEGSAFASLSLPKSQRAFAQSLTAEGRRKAQELRADKRIPESIQFVCVVAQTELSPNTDGVVLCASQWSSDLQKQGIPALRITASHHEAMRDAKIAATLANLVRDSHPRWQPARVEEARKSILRP